MPQPTQADRQRVNHQLKKLGFGGLEDPTLLDQLAFFIRTHESFRGLLMSVKADQRALAYQSLAHRLKFKAKPLEVYEREAKERAEREQWDTWNPRTQMPEAFKVPEIGAKPALEAHAEKAIQEAIESDTKRGRLTITCTKCLSEANVFCDDKLEGHYTLAALGWHIEGDKGICPDCNL